jgi:6-methylsalicylate decarboxylase
MTQPGRIDVHHHFVPPGYAEWLAEQGVMDSGGRSLPAWSRGAATEMMEAHGISAALLSLGGPGVHFGGDGQARTWARRANEFAAEVVKDHPDQFGFLATLPLPDVEGAVAAAAWALDELGADGVMLLANSGGVYLGDPRLEPVMAELNRRAAVVFVHPAALPDAAVAGIPPFAVDFLLDTTRAAANLVRHQVPQRYPRLRFVLAHGGGFLPFASHRIALTLAELTGRILTDALADLTNFWFDTALSSSPAALPSLMAFARPGRIVYGSDWPFAPEPVVGYFIDGMASIEDADLATRDAIDHGAASTLFPRLSR